MDEHIKYKELLRRLIKEYKSYTSVYRSSIQPEKKELLREINDIGDKLIRESLIEHVGHLPTTAIAVYPYLQDNEVDLGETLILLAIHDIGELELGDKMVFLKTEKDISDEEKVATDLLDPFYHKYYNEFEQLSSKNALFAKSIDKMVADIIELILDPELSLERYKVQVEMSQEDIVPAKRNKKMKYMEWNPFLVGFYEYLLVELEKHFSSV